LGELQSIPYGSSGKTILAHLENELTDEIIDAEKFTLKEKQNIKIELDKIRRDRYHVSVSERLEGSTGIGSPILNADNEPIGSIILTAPTPRVTKEVIQTASIDIKSTAIKISKILGSSI